MSTDDGSAGFYADPVRAAKAADGMKGAADAVLSSLRDLEESTRNVDKGFGENDEFALQAKEQDQAALDQIREAYLGLNGVLDAVPNALESTGTAIKSAEEQNRGRIHSAAAAQESHGGVPGTHGAGPRG
jgi:hypothetical protein